MSLSRNIRHVDTNGLELIYRGTSEALPIVDSRIESTYTFSAPPTNDCDVLVRRTDQSGRMLGVFIANTQGMTEIHPSFIFETKLPFGYEAKRLEIDDEIYRLENHRSKVGLSRTSARPSQIPVQPTSSWLAKLADTRATTDPSSPSFNGGNRFLQQSARNLVLPMTSAPTNGTNSVISNYIKAETADNFGTSTFPQHLPIIKEDLRSSYGEAVDAISAGQFGKATGFYNTVFKLTAVAVDKGHLDPRSPFDLSTALRFNTELIATQSGATADIVFRNGINAKIDNNHRNQELASQIKKAETAAKILDDLPTADSALLLLQMSAYHAVRNDSPSAVKALYSSAKKIWGIDLRIPEDDRQTLIEIANGAVSNLRPIVRHLKNEHNIPYGAYNNPDLIAFLPLGYKVDKDTLDLIASRIKGKPQELVDEEYISTLQSKSLGLSTTTRQVLARLITDKSALYGAPMETLLEIARLNDDFVDCQKTADTIIFMPVDKLKRLLDMPILPKQQTEIASMSMEIVTPDDATSAERIKNKIHDFAHNFGHNQGSNPTESSLSTQTDELMTNFIKLWRNNATAEEVFDQEVFTDLEPDYQAGLKVEFSLRLGQSQLVQLVEFAKFFNKPIKEVFQSAEDQLESTKFAFSFAEVNTTSPVEKNTLQLIIEAIDILNGSEITEERLSQLNSINRTSFNTHQNSFLDNLLYYCKYRRYLYPYDESEVDRAESKLEFYHHQVQDFAEFLDDGTTPIRPHMLRFNRKLQLDLADKTDQTSEKLQQNLSIEQQLLWQMVALCSLDYQPNDYSLTPLEGVISTVARPINEHVLPVVEGPINDLANRFATSFDTKSELIASGIGEITTELTGILRRFKPSLPGIKTKIQGLKARNQDETLPIEDIVQPFPDTVDTQDPEMSIEEIDFMPINSVPAMTIIRSHFDNQNNPSSWMSDLIIQSGDNLDSFFEHFENRIIQKFGHDEVKLNSIYDVIIPIHRILNSTDNPYSEEFIKNTVVKLTNTIMFIENYQT